MMQANGKNLMEVIQEVTSELRRTNFKETVIAKYGDIWDKLVLFAEQQGEDCYTLKLGQDFLEIEYGLFSQPKTDRVSKMRLRAINMLETFQRHGILPFRTPSRQYVYAEPFREVFENFIQHRRLMGIMEKTIQSNQIYLERFSNYLHNHGITSIPDICVSIIQGYLRTLSIYNPPTIYCTLPALRALFRFLYEQKHLTVDLSPHIPSMDYDSRTKIPSVYSKEEIEAIIAQIDRGNPKGKRDYAIVLLAAKLGLRASDICNLSFKDVRWELNTIETVQQKTKEPLVLPLLNEVGDALIDYLKYGRPQSPLPYIFLRHVPPMDKLKSPTLHSIVTQYMGAAGIPITGARKHGPHALRHSLAGILLQGHTPFPVISRILGHSNSRATSIYLKIDVVQLKACALEVPEYIVARKGDLDDE